MVVSTGPGCAFPWCTVFAQVVRVEPAPEPQASSSSSGPCVVLPEPEAIPDAPDWAKPNRSWVQQFVADFQQLRVQVQHAYQQQGGACTRAGSAKERSLHVVLRLGRQGQVTQVWHCRCFVRKVAVSHQQVQRISRDCTVHGQCL
jgi:hypothetical protein